MFGNEREMKTNLQKVLHLMTHYTNAFSENRDGSQLKQRKSFFKEVVCLDKTISHTGS
jgi:hypothetical protein